MSDIGYGPNEGALMTNKTNEVTRLSDEEVICTSEAKKARVLDGAFDHQPTCRAPDYQECTCKPAAERQA